MDEKQQRYITAELSALYEIPSLSFSESLDELGEQAIERATRLFGIRRFALFAGEGTNRRLVASCGMRGPGDAEARVQQGHLNQFRYTFSGHGAMGEVFLEHANLLGERERRLYTVFAHRIESVLKELQAESERRQVEAELRSYREHLEELVKERTEELAERYLELQKEIADRKLVTGALRFSEEKYRTLFEASTDAIFLETIDGEIVDSNSAACKMLGYDKEELIGMNVMSLVPEALAEDLPDRVADELSHGVAFLESVNQRKNGEVFPVEVSARLVELEGEQGVVVFVRDITDRKQAEEERWAMRQRVADAREREILERTNRLTSLGFLAAGVAHEVNNPLQGMLSHLEAVKKALPTDFSRVGSIEMLETGIQAIADVVRKLLVLSREPNTTRETVDYGEALDFVVQLLRHQFKRAKVDVKREDPAKPLKLGMAQRDLTQVLVNLFINSMDAMPNGGTLTVKALARGDWCVIELEDTGRGMSKRILSQIFTPFFTTKGTKGTGLGLSVTESLMRHCGGKVEVESEPNKGSRFVLQIPMARGRGR